MREYKIRGKTIQEGRWVKGYLYAYNQGFRIEDEWWANDVIPETLGQYTGLPDENKQDVYEGDILFDDSGDDVYEVKFEDGKFVAILDGNVELDLSEVAYRCSVIGNIHDNPELLEGKVE